MRRFNSSSPGMQTTAIRLKSLKPFILRRWAEAYAFVYKNYTVGWLVVWLIRVVWLVVWLIRLGRLVECCVVGQLARWETRWWLPRRVGLELSRLPTMAHMAHMAPRQTLFVVVVVRPRLQTNTYLIHIYVRVCVCACTYCPHATPPGSWFVALQHTTQSFCFGMAERNNSWLNNFCIVAKELT